MLIFEYAVAADDYDDDGVSIASDALVSGGALISSVASGRSVGLNLGSRAIADEADHRVAGRQLFLSLSLEPSSVTAGSFATATLTLGNAELLAEDTSVRVSLSAGQGLAAPSAVTLMAGAAGTRFRVSVDVGAPPGESSLTASVEPSVQESIRALVSSTTLAVTVSRPPPVVVMIDNGSSVVSVREGAVAIITVRAASVPLEALAIGYVIGTDGDVATADADEDDYTDVAGGTVTIGAGEESATIEVRITDDEAIEVTREFFRVSLTAPPEDAAYVLASPDRTTAIVTIEEGVCDRTEQVRGWIVRAIGGVTDCAEVTDDHLSGITGTLSLTRRGIATLNAGDFSGLGNLGQLRLNDNRLTTLPADVFSGLGNLERLYLYSNNLTILSADAFSGLDNLEVLWLFFNKQLTTLPVGVFSDLGNLRELELWSNQLSTLPAGVFSGLGNLEELYLNDNPLATLPADVFSGLDKLRELDLSGNSLSTLPAGLFSGLDHLRELDLGDNPLSTLPAGIFVGLTLSQLILPPGVAELPLRFIPVDESGSPTSARVTVELMQGAPFEVSVDLFVVNATLSTNTVLIPQGATQSEVFTVWRENPGEVVVVGFAGATLDPPNSEVVFDVSDVFVMDDVGRPAVWISSNLMGGVASVREGETAMITVRATSAPSALTIGYEIGADADAVTADADENDYADVTGGTVTIGAGEESTTIEVRITDDEAIEAPREFFKVSLTAPSEDAAYVLASPDQTTAIVVIKEGVCDRTPQVRGEVLRKISGVNDCAEVTDGHLSRVTRILDLDGKSIATLKAGDFSGLGNLQELRLNNNRLTTLPADVFSGLGNLEQLYLDDNHLSTLPADVFSGLGNLEQLYLDDNHLSTLPADVFSGLGNLRELDLGSNHLSTLPADVFSGLGSLQSLSLLNNPGVPFVFARPRLEPPRTSPGSRVVEVKLVVDEPLPTTMTAALSVEGGELSVEEAVVPEGSSESAVFSVTQTAGAPVSLRASTGVLTDYVGVETAPSELVLDVVGPSVSDVAIVSIPASGDAYRAAAGEVIRVEVGFDEAVEVSTTVAGPSLTLTIGETTRAATYAPDLSDVSTLVFTYALQAGDADADGIGIEEDALVLADAEITDLSGNPMENTSLGGHAVPDAAGHQVIRTFRLRFGPSEVALAPGTSIVVTLVLEGAEALGSEEEVSVGLSASPGLELLTPSPVTMNSGASSRVTVGLKLLEIAGANERSTASASLPDAEFIPGVLDGIRLRTFRAFFEPSAISLVRGGAAEESASMTVVLKTEPALQGSEEMTVDLDATNGLAVSPRSVTLNPTSGTAGITVSASSRCDLWRGVGKVGFR